MGGLGAPELILILIAFGGWFVFAAWGYSAGANRTIGSTGGLLLGLFLGLIGILIVYCTGSHRRSDSGRLRTSGVAFELC